jgi:isoleucyl-tRNA synthetase
VKDEQITLQKDDFEIIEQEKEHMARAPAENMTLFLDTQLTPELEAEGFARELVRRIQSMRKELDLDVEDKIVTELHVDPTQKKTLQQWHDYISNETRSKTVHFVDKPTGKLVKTWKIEQLETTIGITT